MCLRVRRSVMSNVFFITKLVYGLQALHCAGSEVQALHGGFGIFVWGSYCEPMSRDILLLPLGFQLTHLFAHQLVSCFFFLKIGASYTVTKRYLTANKFSLPFSTSLHGSS